MDVLGECYGASLYNNPSYTHGYADCYLPLDYEDYFVFSSIRNPFTRFVAYWNFYEAMGSVDMAFTRCPPLFSQIFTYPLEQVEEDCIPMRLDQFITVENLQEDFNKLSFLTQSHEIKLTPESPYELKLSAALVDRLREYYAIDFKTFGYDSTVVPPELMAE